MRHNYKGRKLGTDFSHTKAMKKSLVNALFLNDRIKTVESRAKEIRPNVDKIITWAKATKKAAPKKVEAAEEAPKEEAAEAKAEEAAVEVAEKAEEAAAENAEAAEVETADAKEEEAAK